MFEAALLLIVAAGSLLLISGQWQRATTTHIQPDTPQWSSTIAHGGLYAISKPDEGVTMSAFNNLQLTDYGLVWRDTRTNQPQFLTFAMVQWVGAVRLGQNGTAQLEIHLEIDGRWRVVTWQLATGEMALLARLLRQAVSSAKSNLGTNINHALGLLPAQLVEETMTGEITIGENVYLYLLPHLLIVLDGDKVQAKLATSSIRRVLAVERVNKSLLSNPPTGIIRLYSLYETAVFALPQYHDLAREISYLARCPLEYITRDEKSNK